MRMPKLWFVIADGGRARFVECTQEGRFRTVSSFLSTNLHKQSRDLGTDRPGRVYESHDSRRHGIDPRHDLHDAEKEDFVGLVIGEIESERMANSFDQFVLVAPPKVLGEFRRALPDKLTSVLSSTLQKDLTNTPDQDLAAHLSTEALLDKS